MKWFEVKEQSAGKKRLVLTYYLYKIFGKKMLSVIAFLVAFFTFVFASKIRNYSKKYFLAVYDELHIKPSLFNRFKHILSYANSLADKFLLYCNDFNSEDIIFENPDDEEKVFEDINKKRGVFFICNHIGNIEIFQNFFITHKPDFNIDVFMSNYQSKIFNGFLKSIGVSFPVKLFPVESIGISTGVELKESLDKGDIVFIAGDRLSENNDHKSTQLTMFNHKIMLPKGTFKLAKLMEVPTYFISVVKNKNKYKIILEKQNDLAEEKLTSAFVKYMERVIKNNPFQFFHFYDFFN